MLQSAAGVSPGGRGVWRTCADRTPPQMIGAAIPNNRYSPETSNRLHGLPPVCLAIGKIGGRRILRFNQFLARSPSPALYAGNHRRGKASVRQVVGQFAVAALSERRNSLRIQDRRSETAATKIKLTHYRPASCRWANCGVGLRSSAASVHSGSAQPRPSRCGNWRGRRFARRGEAVPRPCARCHG